MILLWKKVLFRSFLVKSYPKLAENEFFWVLSKISTWNFSDILHEGTVLEKVKIDVNDFLIIFFLKFLWVTIDLKRTQSEVLREMNAWNLFVV